MAGWATVREAAAARANIANQVSGLSSFTSTLGSLAGLQQAQAASIQDSLAPISADAPVLCKAVKEAGEVDDPGAAAETADNVEAINALIAVMKQNNCP